jgi:oligoendopeptidase F
MSAPQWNLSELVASTDPQGLKAELEAMVDASRKFADAYRGRIADLDAVGLREMLERKDELALRHEGVEEYCSLLFAADMTDPVANELNSAYMKAGTEASKAMAAIGIELGQLLLSRPELMDDPALSDYRHYLERRSRAAPYLLSEAEEKIIMTKDQNGIQMLSKLQGKWLSTRTFEVEIAGQKRSLGIGELYAYMYDPERATRRAVYESIGSTLKRDELLWSDILRTIVADHAAMCKLRGYSSPLEPTLLANDISSGAVEALMRVVQDHVGLCQRYFRIKARLLGLERLGSWDLRAPLPSVPDRKYSWDEAKDIVLSTFRDFDGQFGEWAGDMFERGRIDAQVRRGKRTGAFCSTWVNGRSAFILQSYNGRLNDVNTLAHEMGHAVHAYLYTRAQNYSNCHVSLCIAECGSLMGELLLAERLKDEAASREERQHILVKVLDGFTLSVFQEGFRFLFESSLYEEMEAGVELDGEKISKLWRAAQDRFYGDAVEWLEDSEWDWARFPHHYFAGTRFYNYPYTFAQLFVFSLYRMYKEQGPDFVPAFKELLASGSSRSAAELAAGLGMDIEDPEFWLKGIEQAKAFMAELESTMGDQ